MYVRTLADGTVQAEIIEAERRFFCVYKWVHGVKFQAICLPNGMIGDLAGRLLLQFDVQKLMHVQESCLASATISTLLTSATQTRGCIKCTLFTCKGLQPANNLPF